MVTRTASDDVDTVRLRDERTHAFRELDVTGVVLVVLDDVADDGRLLVHLLQHVMRVRALLDVRRIDLGRIRRALQHLAVERLDRRRLARQDDDLAVVELEVLVRHLEHRHRVRRHDVERAVAETDEERRLVLADVEALAVLRVDHRDRVRAVELSERLAERRLDVAERDEVLLHQLDDDFRVRL